MSTFRSAKEGSSKRASKKVAGRVEGYMEEVVTKDQKREQKRQLEAYQHALKHDPPFNERRVAHQSGYQASGYQQNISYRVDSGAQQTNTQFGSNDQRFAAHDAFGGYYQPNGQYDFAATNNATAAAAAAAAAFNSATTRNYEMDINTSNLVEIIEGKKKNKKSKM